MKYPLTLCNFQNQNEFAQKLNILKTTDHFLSGSFPIITNIHDIKYMMIMVQQGMKALLSSSVNSTCDYYENTLKYALCIANNHAIPDGKIHPCGSDVISELEHRSLCGRNETRTVNREEQYEKSARVQSKRTEIRLATRLVA